MKNALYFLFLTILSSAFFSCDQSDYTAEIESLKNKLETAEKKIADAEANAAQKPALIHTVFFWLKEGISEEEKAKFLAGVQSLSKIEHIQTFYTGPSAGTEDRDVVDHSYDTALICQFKDVKDQEAYQVDPIHLKFVEDCKDLWTKVIVYDNLVK